MPSVMPRSFGFRRTHPRRDAAPKNSATGGMSGERRSATGTGSDAAKRLNGRVGWRHETDDQGHDARRPHQARLDSTETACDDQYDVVEVSVVVETSDP